VGRHPPYYHTALNAGTVLAGPDIDRFEIGRSVAFTHDLTRGLTPEYEACDVFYIEPPWCAGYKIFNQRAGSHDALPYPDFMRLLSGILWSIRVPIYLITGVGELKRLPKPDRSYPITMNGGDYVCALLNGADIEKPTADELLDALAERHACVGDFVCGYGKAAVAFHSRGKQFVVSDFVKACIGVIATRLGPPA
jgi:hypothetical protein